MFWFSTDIAAFLYFLKQGLFFQSNIFYLWHFLILPQNNKYLYIAVAAIIFMYGMLYMKLSMSFITKQNRIGFFKIHF